VSSIRGDRADGGMPALIEIAPRVKLLCAFRRRNSRQRKITSPASRRARRLMDGLSPRTTEFAPLAQLCDSRGMWMGRAGIGLVSAILACGCGEPPSDEGFDGAQGGLDEAGEVVQALSNACGVGCCDVRQFGAVANDGVNDAAAIQQAITAALSTSHRYVYIPNGTWDVGSTIDMTSQTASRVMIAGQSSKGTRLRWMNNLNYHMFNTEGGYSYFKVDLRTMTLDGSHLPWSSGSGHGVRARNGWDSGYLHMANLNIVHPGFYGVGIQNGDVGQKAARSIWLTDSFIGATGSDGIDLKAPPDSNNVDVHINNVVFHDVGNSERALDDEGTGSDAAIDMTADGFGIYRVTIVTDAYKNHPTGTNVIEGIRLRKRGDSWDEPAARNGSISRTYIKYSRTGIFFEGWNKNISIDRSTIKSVPSAAIYLRGVGSTIASTVCAVDAGTQLKINTERGDASELNNTVDGPISTCLAMSEVGALTTNRDSNNWIDVSEPKNCDVAP
jgi:hypothetical protein